MQVLVLGASYGSLFGMKCLMAGHDVSLVCTQSTADLINDTGISVRIRLAGDDQHREFNSSNQTSKLQALTPDQVDPKFFDFAVLAMQEPKYSASDIKPLISELGEHKVPCLSLSRMPSLPYLKRIGAVDTSALGEAYTDVRIWDGFDPDFIALSAPDPRARRPVGHPNNVLSVRLAADFVATKFGSDSANSKLSELASSIEDVREIGRDVPVKLRVNDSLFAPLANWSKLIAGNYRCVTGAEPRSLAQTVHDDLETSRVVYDAVGGILTKMGASERDLVPFETYAQAALCLPGPSSFSVMLAEGETEIGRVDKLVQIIGRQLGIRHPEIDRTVALVDKAIKQNAVSEVR